ncbi:MAG: hypothetical protein AAGF93_16940 [Cyanobacteria bacterium P01_H01_bin.105]
MNTVLIEVAVIMTLVGSTTLYLAMRRWLRQRQAWQWWHRRQTDQLHQQAEAIRDDLLQQTFAFRRYLEDTLTTQPDSAQTEQWLERFQAFYHSLERLSDQLSPPFVADSLPLALQFMVSTWQRSHPGLIIQLSVPADWPEQSAENNPAILSIITGLIELLVPAGGCKHQLQLTLERQNNWCTLTFKQVQTQTANSQPLTDTSEVDHLKEIFRSLTAGRLEVVVDDSELVGQLCWQDS